MCHICGKTMRNRQLSIHIKVVHKKIIRFRCDYCDKGYYLNCDLQDHIKLMHKNPSKTEKCTMCNFSCYRPSRLKLHILQKHETKPAPFKCNKCCKGFYSLKDLRSHMTRHGPKNYKCLAPECEWRFHTRSTLITHGKRAHKIDFSNDVQKGRRGRPKPSAEDSNEYEQNGTPNILSNSNGETETALLEESDQEIDYMEVEYLEDE